MPEEAVRDQEFCWLWAIFDHVNVRMAKKMCPPDFSWSSLHPESGITALQTLIYPLMTTNDEQGLEDVFDMAQWMIAQGADPTHKTTDSCQHNEEYWQGEKGERAVSLDFAGMSALTVAIRLIDTLKECDEDHWSEDIESLNRLLAIFSSEGPRGRQSRVAVDTGVVDLWEMMCEDTATHDVTLEAMDGRVTAHVAVLSKGSPVLSAMLASGMSEGWKRTIEVKDASVQSVKLCLMLLYSGATTAEFSHEVALTALDLAHRWQISNVVAMLENALTEMISDETFLSIAETAKRQGLVSLMTACRKFGTDSKVVQEALEARTLPGPVLELMGALGERPKPSKKRRTW